jgi:hypothetical protein
MLEFEDGDLNTMAFRTEESPKSVHSRERTRSFDFLNFIVWLAAIIVPWLVIGEVVVHIPW